MQPALTSKILLLIVSLALSLSMQADAPEAPGNPLPAREKEDTSRFEISPWIKKVDIIKTADLVRVIVKASAQTECYKQREIERTFEKNTVKIVMRLKKTANTQGCPTTVFDYEEKVYESPIDLAPPNIWILGYEGWHKLKVQ